MKNLLKQERHDNSLAKIESIRSYTAGWDLGRGEKPSEVACNNAAILISECYKHNAWKTSVFPFPSGSILVAFLVSEKIDIEVVAEIDGSFSFRCESDGYIDVERSGLVLREACDLVILYSNENLKTICLSESLITRYTTTKSVSVIGVPPLRHQAMVDFLDSHLNARQTPVVEYASISKNTMKKSPEVQFFTGGSPMYQPIPLRSQSRPIKIPAI